MSAHDRSAAAFRAEARRVSRALRDAHVTVCDIEHFGSTAVPEAAVSDTVDVLVGVIALPVEPSAVRALSEIGYAPGLTGSAPGREYWSRPGFHVHLVSAGGPCWRAPLLLRDYLAAHPQRARDYRALKLELQARHPGDRHAYGREKRPFIERALLEAQQWRPVPALPSLSLLRCTCDAPRPPRRANSRQR